MLKKIDTLHFLIWGITENLTEKWQKQYKELLPVCPLSMPITGDILPQGCSHVHIFPEPLGCVMLPLPSYFWVCFLRTKISSYVTTERTVL